MCEVITSNSIKGFDGSPPRPIGEALPIYLKIIISTFPQFDIFDYRIQKLLFEFQVLLFIFIHLPRLCIFAIH